MNVKDLVLDFISHSPAFYDDSSLKDIDNKHSAIMSKAYGEINKFSIENFRNWAGQSDLGGPAEFSSSLGLVKGFVRPLYRKIFRRQIEQMLLQAMLDDVNVIRHIRAEQLLLDNPVHLTPGAGDYCTVGGVTANFRWLRYIYLTKRITDLKILADGGTWIDIGGYYGGLQGLVRKYNPKARIILVDFHHQLCRSYVYLAHLFPDARHVFPDQIGDFESYEDAPEGSITYVPALAFDGLASRSVDLATNFFSFGEMRRSVFKSYMESRTIITSKILFLVNRFVSSPFFEPTYDTDLNIFDYMLDSRKIDYFDVFPMHHYMVVNRELFGRVGMRNTSSSYFEFVSSASS